MESSFDEYEDVDVANDNHVIKVKTIKGKCRHRVKRKLIRANLRRNPKFGPSICWRLGLCVEKRPKKVTRKPYTCVKKHIHGYVARHTKQPSARTIQRDFSFAVSVTLGLIGASEIRRNNYKQAGIRMEILGAVTNHLLNLKQTEYVFGSSSEGTTTEGLNSDTDAVLCNEYNPLVVSMDEVTLPCSNKPYLMVRDDNTFPGYVKLQAINSGQPVFMGPVWIDGHDKYAIDNKGRLCLRHYTTIAHNNPDGEERHGPADTEPENELFFSPQDNVWAFRCKTIPPFTSDWIHRTRGEWPSYSQLRKMEKCGCFVVGVGHPYSNEREIEWRLSFSLQERVLMFGMNEIQHQCYILLKMVKKELINVDEDNKYISSYHCKTCMFYVMENTQPDLWKPSNLVNCLRLCLLVLLSWAWHGNCPNYFINEENMFDKPQFRRTRNHLIERLRQLVAEGPAIILRIRSDGIGYFLTTLNGKYLGGKERMLFGPDQRLIQCVLYHQNRVSQLAQEYSSDKTLVEDFSSAIEMLQDSEVTEHTREETRDALTVLLPALHLQIAKRLVSRAMKTRRNPDMDELDYHLKPVKQYNVMQYRLIWATILYRLQQFENCMAVLAEADNDLNEHIPSYCRCYAKQMYLDDQEFLLGLRLKPIDYTIRESISCCVVFLPRDREIMPYPFHFEMHRSVGAPPLSRHEKKDHWFDWAVVGGKAYLYFLQYLVYTKLHSSPCLKENAISKLKRDVMMDPNLGHGETACNLLAWIYIQEDRIRDAWKYYQLGWLRYRKNHNAAKWHLRKFLSDFSE